MASRIDRRWINAPSRLQPMHDYHGKNVFAAFDHNGYPAVIYFVEGAVSSMVVSKDNLKFLSNGWRK